ncbi:MAG: DNA polymerase III subunit delta [Nitrospinae bacterium]|nr:DNA polymerase III subunit delta [Nitrospinota bacterium]
MDPRELERRLKRQEVAPLMLLWGEETLLIDEAVQQIEALALDPATREFNRDIFYGDEADAHAILTAAQTIPWLASYRMVCVRGVEALPRTGDEPLVAYCQHPSPSTCLIFTAHKIELDRPLFSLLAKMSWALRFRPLFARELSVWVAQRVQARGCRITAEAISALLEAVGNDLRLLASEIDKLVIFVGSGETIDEAVLAATTGDVRETSAFELARLLSAGELAGALRAWQKLSTGGGYPGMALGAIVHHVRQLWRVKLEQRSGASTERIASALNIPVFTVRRLSESAAKIEPDMLYRWFEALLEADQALKRSGLPTQTVFERLILRLCRGNVPDQPLA